MIFSRFAGYGLMKGNTMKTIKTLSYLALVLVMPVCSAFGAEKTQHNFEKWEKEISAYEKADATNPPPKGAILFIGSSTVRMWKTLAQDFSQHQVINRGFGGSQIVDATHFAPRVIFPYAPKAIYLRSGGNDLWAGKSAEEVFGDFTNFVATIHAKLPASDIIYISLCPCNSRWKQAGITKTLNELIADFIKGKAHLRTIETYDMAQGADNKPRTELFLKDQLHFNAEGYKLLADRVRPDLERYSKTSK
jgi:lysophospholipase L1-like esterase